MSPVRIWERKATWGRTSRVKHVVGMNVFRGLHGWLAWFFQRGFLWGLFVFAILVASSEYHVSFGGNTSSKLILVLSVLTDCDSDEWAVSKLALIFRSRSSRTNGTTYPDVAFRRIIYIRRSRGIILTRVRPVAPPSDKGTFKRSSLPATHTQCPLKEQRTKEALFLCFQRLNQDGARLPSRLSGVRPWPKCATYYDRAERLRSATRSSVPVAGSAVFISTSQPNKFNFV